VLHSHDGSNPVAVAFVRGLAARTRAETMRSAHGVTTEALVVANALRLLRAGGANATELSS
jgi:hypothetical protein